MKRISLCWLLCAVCLSAYALIPYDIYEWQGDVMYKNAKDNRWMPAAKGVTLVISDSLRIGAKGSVCLVDKDRHEKIKSLSEGRLTVAQIIDQARKADSKSILAAIYDELAKKQLENNNPCPMTTKGAAARDINDHHSLKPLAKTFAWIGKQAADSTLPTTHNGLVLRKNNIRDEWTFTIENNTTEEYCVNVLHVNRTTGIVSLCFVLAQSDSSFIIAPPHCQYAFTSKQSTLNTQPSTLLSFPSTADDIYVLVATTDPYDTEAMNDELYYHTIHSARPEDSTIPVLYAL